MAPAAAKKPTSLLERVFDFERSSSPPASRTDGPSQPSLSTMSAMSAAHRKPGQYLQYITGTCVMHPAATRRQPGLQKRALGLDRDCSPQPARTDGQAPLPGQQRIWDRFKKEERRKRMAFRPKKKRLGDMLIENNAITEEQLKEALEKQKQKKAKLGQVLVSMGFTTEDAIARAIMNQMDIEMVTISEHQIPEEVLRVIPDAAILKKYMVMPFAFSERGSLLLAMDDPMDLMAIDDISIITGLQVEPLVATSSDVMTAVDKYYGNEEARAVAEAYTREQESMFQPEEEGESDDVTNAPIVQLVKTLIEQAVRKRASDIHIEPLETRIRVRNRVDGVLIEVGNYPVGMLAAIIARIKIIGGMDISEKRKPQDGRITQVVDRVEYDIRASILPTVFGEKVVMRLTAKTVLTRDKKLLGFSDEELEKFDNILGNPNGIILVTGPTGSGKSTTLYTALSELNSLAVNIITVEDPVEANIDGINQVQVNPKADLTFASTLRSILRQDPDIIMIGEIRDRETANIAVTASITGHLVVSTLHTNSAAASITRLSDMGIEPYLIADATVGVIAQRLVRRLCDCRTMRKATDVERKLLKVTNPKEALMIGEPCGCVKCSNTGYKGRTGVYEIMPITRRMRDAIAAGNPTDELEKIAVEEGMHTLRDSCIRLVKEGVTTITEMEKITYANDNSL